MANPVFTESNILLNRPQDGRQRRSQVQEVDLAARHPPRAPLGHRAHVDQLPEVGEKCSKRFGQRRFGQTRRRREQRQRRQRRRPRRQRRRREPDQLLCHSRKGFSVIGHDLKNFYK